MRVKIDPLLFTDSTESSPFRTSAKDLAIVRPRPQPSLFNPSGLSILQKLVKIF
jgi:hypothetical protein